MTAVEVLPQSTVAPTEQPKRRRRRIPLGRSLAVLWLGIVIIGATFAPLIAPDNPLQQSLSEILKGPSAAHLLGTDDLGRDLLSRLLYGGRETLIGVAIAMACYMLIGTAAGLLAGYLRGWFDKLALGFSNIAMSLPSIILLFAVLSVYRGNTYIAMFVFGALSSPIMFLLVRSSVLSLREQLFVDAAKVSGLPTHYILGRHILPRIWGVVVSQTAVFGANAVVLESALSFLGFGQQPPNPTWGNMVSEAATQISLNPWMLYPTGGVIALTALSLGVVGDLLRDRIVGGWALSKLTKNARKGRRVQAVDQSWADETLLSVDGLWIGYRVASGDVVPIVKDVSLSVGRSEILGVVGESGSGKSTLAFGILGVVGQGLEVTRGSVRFDGTTLSDLADNEWQRFRGRRIAYVAQEPMVSLNPYLKVGTQLEEAIRVNGGLARGARRARALELLRMVELRDPPAVMDRYLHELSGGMAQRVATAFALAGDPELLVADEPTTALDVTVQAGILGLLLRLREKLGMSMIIITHDWGVIADVCDRVAVMYRGEIVEQSPVTEIFSVPKHPYTQALLRSNPHGAEPGVDLPVITGSFPTPLVPDMDVTARALEGATSGRG